MNGPYDAEGEGDEPAADSLDDLARPPTVPPPAAPSAPPPVDDGEYEELAAPRGCGRRAGIGLLVAAVLLVGVAVGGWLWLRSQLDPSGGPGATVEVAIPAGSSTGDIGSVLERNGVVPNGDVFRWWVSWKGRGPFQAGRYVLRRNSSVSQAADVLAEGPLPPPVVKLSIPEGFRVGQIAARIHEKIPRFSEADVRAALDQRRIPSTLLPAGSNDYEGLLFPATYEVGERESLDTLLGQMAAGMDRRASTEDFKATSQRLNLTPYELITVASLIQAEAGNPDEAPKIARVIYNRMRTGQPLGIDATSRYLSIIEGKPVDFESTSPYNTRRRPGLPPTPIAAPGDFAIDAAVHPADGPWTWYVLDVDKDAQGRPQHVFTDSQAEFERAKRACRDAGLGCG